MSNPTRAAFRFALLVALAGPLPAAARGLPPYQPPLDAATFDAHLRFLAGDLLEGRGIGTRGGRLAAAYIESVFEAAGLRPGSPAGFLQQVPMESFAPDPAATIEVAASPRFVLGQGDDFAVINCGQENGRLAAEPLFVGYAIDAPEEGWDDFKNADLHGRLLIALVNEPGRDDPGLFRGRALTIHGRWRTKLEEAARRGAAGMLLVHTDADAGYPWDVARTTATKPTLALADDPARLPVSGWIREDAARRIVSAAGMDLDSLRSRAGRRSFTPVPLPVTVTIAAALSRHDVAGTNVVGILPGAGESAVVLTAHLDHLGIGRPVEGDSIYNGAIDNGTALATLLSLAQGYARADSASHPTLVFVAADAEEEGLLGSVYQTRHPAVPLDRTVAAINFEMSNPWGRTRDLLVIGAPYAAFAKLLDRTLTPRHMRVTSDPAPEQGYMFRSDQLAWARAGVPAVWIDGGVDYADRPAGWGAAKRAEYRTATYHRPTDEVRPDFDLSGLVQLAEVASDLIHEIAAGQASGWKTDPDLLRVKAAR